MTAAFAICTVVFAADLTHADLCNCIIPGAEGIGGYDGCSAAMMSLSFSQYGNCDPKTSHGHCEPLLYDWTCPGKCPEGYYYHDGYDHPVTSESPCISTTESSSNQAVSPPDTSPPPAPTESQAPTDDGGGGQQSGDQPSSDASAPQPDETSQDDAVAAEREQEFEAQQTQQSSSQDTASQNDSEGSGDDTRSASPTDNSISTASTAEQEPEVFKQEQASAIASAQGAQPQAAEPSEPMDGLVQLASNSVSSGEAAPQQVSGNPVWNSAYDKITDDYAPPTLSPMTGEFASTNASPSASPNSQPENSQQQPDEQGMDNEVEQSAGVQAGPDVHEDPQGVAAKCNGSLSFSQLSACGSLVKSFFSSYPAPGMGTVMDMIGQTANKIQSPATDDDSTSP
ncbi:MAG: hypothetical protein WCE23_01160 [Candidatus Binatus sp.]